MPAPPRRAGRPSAGDGWPRLLAVGRAKMWAGHQAGVPGCGRLPGREGKFRSEYDEAAGRLEALIATVGARRAWLDDWESGQEGGWV